MTKKPKGGLSLTISVGENGIASLIVFNHCQPVFQALSKNGQIFTAWAVIWNGETQHLVQSREGEVAQFLPFMGRPA